MANTNVQSKNIVRFAIATVIILLIPLVAMQFSDGVQWTIKDFVTAGALLFGTGLMYELLTSRFRNPTNKIIIGLVLMALLTSAWVLLATGD